MRDRLRALWFTGLLLHASFFITDLFAVPPVQWNGPQTIGLPHSHDSGGPIFSADFNSDGQPDIALYQVTWRIYLNHNGVLSFKTEVAGDKWTTACGDFNGDGLVDIASNNQLSLGNGDGTFQDPFQWFSVIQAGDFNGDGELDILHWATNTYALSLNNGDGTYSFGAPLPNGHYDVGKILGTTRDQVAVVMSSNVVVLDWIGDSLTATTNYLAVEDIAIADLGGDNKDDLIAVKGDLLYLLRSVGDGTFEEITTFPRPSYWIRDALTGDFNGDGYADLLFLFFETFQIRYGSPDHTWSNPIVFAADQGLPSFTLDLDEDSKTDLLRIHHRGWYPRLEVLLSTGNHLSHILPVEPYPTASGDFNNDGRMDFLSGHYDQLLVMLPTAGNMQFKFKSVTAWPYSQPVADFDVDGKLDVVVRTLAGLITLLGDGTGEFRRTPTALKETPGESFDAADFNGDKRPDLLLSLDGKAMLSSGKGDGSFDAKMQIAAADGIDDLRACDWNNDGNPDFVCVTTNRGVSVYKGHGNGTFSLHYDRRFSNTNWGSTPKFHFADFNRDGRTDIVVACTFITVLFQTPDGDFTTVHVHRPRDYAWRFGTGDFNGDGYPDMMFNEQIMTPTAKTVFLLGTGTTSFEVQESSEILYGPGDYNDDGRLDFLSYAMAYYNTTPFRKRSDLLWQDTNGAVYSWLFRGTNFAEVETVRGRRVDSQWRAAGMGDFNADGDGDLFWHHKDGRIVCWIMRGTHVEETRPIRTGPARSTGWHIAALGDFNNDNNSDFLWKNTLGQLRVWLMDGTNTTTSTLLREGKPIAANRRVAATADFNGDGYSDILWQNDQNVLSVSFMNGTEVTGFTELREGTAATLGWKAVAAQDLNEDNSPDILFHHASGKVAAWYMNGSTFQNAQILRNNIPTPRGWRAIGAK